jgi:hypothetical protein
MTTAFGVFLLFTEHLSELPKAETPQRRMLGRAMSEEWFTSQYCSGTHMERLRKTKKFLSGYWVFRPRFEPSTYRIQDSRVTAELTATIFSRSVDDVSTRRDT